MHDKRPFLPIYYRDFMEDEKVKLMSWDQRGMYFYLLFHQWAEGSIPSEPDAQLSLLGLELSSSLAPACLSVAERCFLPLLTDSTRLANPKLERVRLQHTKKEQVFHERAVIAGRARQAQLKLQRSSQEAQLKTASQSQSQSQREETLPKVSLSAQADTHGRKARVRSALDLIEQGLMPNLDASVPS